MRLVELNKESATARQILENVGEPTIPPAIAPVRLPPADIYGWQLYASKAVNAISELEFVQTAHLTAEAGHDKLLHDASKDAEPVPELHFDRPAGW